MELFHGRPKSREWRAPVELRAYDLLDGLGIDYYRVDHEPATSMEVCHDIDEALGALICKNLFLCNRQKTDFYLLMMPEREFKTKELSGQLGVSRLSFAGEEHMEELLGVRPGSVSVLGLMNDAENRVRLLIEEDVLKNEFFGCHPCMNTSSVRIKTADLLEKILPAVRHEPTVVRL